MPVSENEVLSRCGFIARLWSVSSSGRLYILASRSRCHYTRDLAVAMATSLVEYAAGMSVERLLM